jgi:hypothetical protein
MVTWDDLERVGYYKEDNIRVSMNLNGAIMYEAKGFHSPACVAKYNYLARKAMLKSIEEQSSRNKNRKRQGHDKVEIRKNVWMTLDGGKKFFLGESRLTVNRKMHIVLLLGSKFMIEKLIKCSSVFINQTEVALGYEEKTWLLSFMGMDKSGECIPMIHLLLDKTKKKLVVEGLKMVLREIYNFLFKTNNRSNYNYLPKSKTGNIIKDLQMNKKWKVIFCHKDDQISVPCREVLQTEVIEGNFWLTIEMERERQRLKIPKSSKTSIVISICQTLWVVHRSERDKVFKKLFSQVSQERDKNLESLIYFFKDLIEERGNGGNGEEVIGFSKGAGEMTKRFHKSIKTEMKREKVTLEIVLNILRFYELEFRQNILNGKIQFQDLQMTYDDVGLYDGHLVNVEDGYVISEEENIDINIDINSQKDDYRPQDFQVRYIRR